MDPVSAFGVAASVLQFINFTETLLCGTYKIYKSATTTGDTKINCDLMTVTTSLKTLSDDLQSSIGREILECEMVSQCEAEIGRICKQCSELAEELISKLQKLRVQKQHNLWESFRKALQMVWTRAEIESLEKRLETFRIQILLQINASLREQVGCLQATQVSQGHHIYSSLQELRQILLEQVSKNDFWQQKVLDAVSPSMRLGLPGPLITSDCNSLLLSTENRFDEEFTARFHKALLRSLHFDDMDRRSRGVSIPYPKTFEWIYSNQSENSFSSFIRFLEEDQNLFWITGKPASGKSTLMKMISEDDRTMRHLKLWASGEDVFLSRFYFWCSGIEKQMSQEGLVRTLLYEALEQLPHLIPIAFPDRMENFTVLGNWLVDKVAWDTDKLLQYCKQVMLEITKSQRIFLLIDGLDEFKGDHSERLKLIEFLYSLLGLSSNVKICVSSRPWNVFEDAFHTRPSLRVEDLTLLDIKHYVSSNLSSNLGFADLQRGDPEIASSLINNVSTKADGVFLWVVLVVGSLVEGLTDGERLSDLQRRLDSLPADIETLFWNILKSVDFGRASQLIQIIEISIQSGSQALTAIQLFFADEDDPAFIFQLQPPTQSTRRAKLSSQANLIKRRINACSKGLLELRKKNDEPLANATVQYLHRSVRDFVQRSDIWSKLCEATLTPFNPVMRLAISTIACFKMSYLTSTYGSEDTNFWELLIASMIDLYRHCTPGMLHRLLDELGKAAGTTMASGVAGHRIKYHQCPLTTSSDELAVSSFLDVAVKLQLNSYVKWKAISLRRVGGENPIDLLSNLFQMAVSEYQVTHRVFRAGNPSLRLVETFLELGINPNQRLPRTQKFLSYRLRTFSEENMTIWQFVISDSAKRPEVLKLFLRYGADPFVPELDSPELYMYEDGNNLRSFLCEMRKETIKNGTKWDDAESASRTTSRWAQFRDQKRFGRRT